jgi:endonuclease/exonuclease/phosphatase family metal-dependent hydrolase
MAPHASNDLSATDLRILTYNIHHANPPSKLNLIDIEAITNVINLQQPDLVALQEIDVHTNRSGKTLNEAKEIARLTGMKYYFAKAIDYDSGEYGVAILSKFPMEKMTNNPLPTAEGTGGEYRTLATAVINLPGNKKIVFASTHLDAQRSDTNRLLQIKKITEFFQDEKLPVIIAGDFNAVPNSSVINILDKSFTRTCISNCGSTVPVIIPTKTIDFIAYKPSDKFIVIEQKVIDEQYASDHRPVHALLKLK